MSIDSLCENIIAKLTAQDKILSISQHLRSLKTNDERVLYIYDIIKDFNAFPTILSTEKSDKVSIHYRNLGNEYFQQSDNYRAWQCYNLSLLYANVDTESYILAISNRSAVFFTLEKYKESLNDVETVLSMKYPEKIKEKLEKRKISCQQKILENDGTSDNKLSLFDKILQSTRYQNTRFPGVSPKLELVSSMEMGRHIVAKADIKVGEILVQEEPYFILLLKSQLLFACSYCLSRSLNLLPCRSCCFALYCSEECKDKSYKEYHRVECPLMATLIDMEFTKLELLALRTVIKARTDQSDWKSLLKYIEEVDKNNDTEYMGHVKIGNDWVYDSKYYASIHTLASNVELRSVSDIFQKSVSAAVFLWLLINATEFLKSDNQQEAIEIKKLVAGLLLHHDMTSPINMHGISYNIETAEGKCVDEFSIASAPYAYHSLINHSCAPNVVRFNKLGTGQMVLMALRPIKKGMQIFDNYGYHHAIDHRMTRCERLKFQYKFVCKCEACSNNWPTYMEMIGSSSLIPMKLRVYKEEVLSMKAVNQLEKGDKATSENLFKLLCQLAEKFEPFAPCGELADCQEALKQCLNVLGGVVPYGCSGLVEWNARPPI